LPFKKIDNIGIIIQARLNSKRFPKKILKRIKGLTIIEILLKRLTEKFDKNKIFIATTKSKDDLEIVNIAKKKKIQYFQGKSKDVLSRYYLVAKKYKLKHIIRITSDCPLVETSILEKIIGIYFTNNYDHVYLDNKFAEGLDCEIFNFKSLEKAYKMANKKSEKEHVTLFFRNKKYIKCYALKNDTDDSKYRVTLDYPEDFKVIKSIILALYKNNGFLMTFKQIKKYLNSTPKVFALNNKIVRNDGLIRSMLKD
tara:strand:- start:330 stop:1091 length:762 start_codon:yes stop_codon:yes gene_type:complete